MSIKVNKQDVVDGLRTVNKGALFPGFNPNDDNVADFVSVVPDGRSAEEVTVTYDVNFVVAASEASDFQEFTRAAGAIVPVVAGAVASPGTGTVVNGLQVVADQLSAAFTNPRSFETFEFKFPAVPVPPAGRPETYSATLIVKADALVTDTTPEPFGGEDQEEFASLFAQFNVSDQLRSREEPHRKEAPRVQDVTISLPITGLTSQAPFEVSTRVRPQATTDGGAGVAVSLVKVEEVKVVLKAVPGARPADGAPRSPADGAPGAAPGNGGRPGASPGAVGPVGPVVDPGEGTAFLRPRVGVVDPVFVEALVRREDLRVARSDLDGARTAAGAAAVGADRGSRIF